MRVGGAVHRGSNTFPGVLWAVPEAARPMAGSAVVLYLLGGLLVVASVPAGGPMAQRWPLLTVAIVALATGGLLHHFADRLPLVGYVALTAFAALLITAAVHVGGPTAFAYEFFYVWVAAWAFYWLTPRVAWLEMGWMAAVSGVEMLHRVPAGEVLAIVAWVTMLVTACSTGLLLVFLGRQHERDSDQLSWRRQQLADVMAGLPLSVFALDRRGMVTMLEGSALRRYERPTSDLVGRSIFDLLPTDHALAAAARRALAGEEVIGPLPLREGEYEFRMTPMYDSAGTLVRVSGTLVDVTEPRQLAREAGERRARELFLAKVSHELRTPLNAMLGYLQLLDRSTHALTTKQRTYLDNVGRAARLQLELVTDLLDLQRLRSDELTFTIETVAVSDLVEQAVDVVEPLATQKGIRLLVGRGGSDIATDRRRVQQALLNLLSNAVKFSPAGSEIKVWVRRDRDVVAIQVVDQGPGLAESELERIFDEFYQARSAGTQQEGTGLGLAISRQIVRRLGGDVTVKSRPGKGATFTIVLPAGPRTIAENPPSELRTG